MGLDQFAYRARKCREEELDGISTVNEARKRGIFLIFPERLETERESIEDLLSYLTSVRLSVDSAKNDDMVEALIDNWDCGDTKISLDDVWKEPVFYHEWY